MRNPRGFQAHQCCPPTHRQVPNITGDYDFDASLVRSKNTDLAAKFRSHLATGGPGYGPLTAYCGYSNYSGDS
jgi:hypothetical protein